MNRVALNDQKRYELALAMGIIDGNYTLFSARLTAEQHSLEWSRVIYFVEN